MSVAYVHFGGVMAPGWASQPANNDGLAVLCRSLTSSSFVPSMDSSLGNRGSYKKL